MKITAVIKQKNEGAFLLEWIAYHKVIGFSNIVVLSNDCEDGSDEFLLIFLDPNMRRSY